MMLLMILYRAGSASHLDLATTLVELREVEIGTDQRWAARAETIPPFSTVAPNSASNSRRSTAVDLRHRDGMPRSARLVTP